MSYLSTLPHCLRAAGSQLGLNEGTCVTSHALRLWCEQNKDSYFIPERLLARWEIVVNSSLAWERNDSAA
jgi:hypothetical protein